jgi:7-cyano-7-deazaguanine synthase
MKIVCLFSGGLDSTTLLYSLHKAGNTVIPLTIDYGQRHRRELHFAMLTLEDLWIRSKIVVIDRGVFQGSQSALISDAMVPEGHYAAPNMVQTIVPNRNALLLATAYAVAESVGAEAVAIAAHAGDHPIYPDCRPDFFAAFEHMQALALGRVVSLLVPFVGLTKADIVHKGAAIHVPFEKTWSCYNGREFHCGKCGTCVERQEAFALAKVPDPTTYEEDDRSFENMGAQPTGPGGGYSIGSDRPWDNNWTGVPTPGFPTYVRGEDPGRMP